MGRVIRPFYTKQTHSDKMESRRGVGLTGWTAALLQGAGRGHASRRKPPNIHGITSTIPAARSSRRPDKAQIGLRHCKPPRRQLSSRRSALGTAQRPQQPTTRPQGRRTPPEHTRPPPSRSAPGAPSARIPAEPRLCTTHTRCPAWANRITPSSVWHPAARVLPRPPARQHGAQARIASAARRADRLQLVPPRASPCRAAPRSPGHGQSL